MSESKPKQSKAWMIGVLLGLVVIAVLVWFFVFKDGGCKDDEEMVGTKCLVKCTDGKIRVGEVCRKKEKVKKSIMQAKDYLTKLFSTSGSKWSKILKKNAKNSKLKRQTKKRK